MPINYYNEIRRHNACKFINISSVFYRSQIQKISFQENMKNLPFIFILFYIGTKVCKSFCESRERTYWVVRDHLSSDSKYKLATTTSFEQCAKQCSEDKQCGGANFNTTSKSCAMISKETSSLASLIKQIGSFYIHTLTESQSNVSFV